MGLDGMRVGSGRCPSLLVGALLLSCFLLVCNWWSLSTKNMELYGQIDELYDELHISDKDLKQCQSQRDRFNRRNKELEDDIAALHVRLQQINELKLQKNDVEESLTMCKTELESLKKLDATKSATLETLRLEKDTLSTQLDAKTDESQQLKKDLDAAVSEIQGLKLSVDDTPKKQEQKKDDSPLQLAQDLTRLEKFGHLPTIAESAVNIAVPGKNGIEYHGIPILPIDPPGAVRQTPRFSVTLRKASTSEPGEGKISADGDANEEDGNAAEADASGPEKQFIQPEDMSNPKTLDEPQ